METIDYLEVQESVEAARTAFKSWGRLPLEERSHFLRLFKSRLLLRQEELALTISQETGKPLWESTEEVAAMAQKIDLSMEAYNERCPKVENPPLYTRHKPHGVVAVFGPFNFPGHIPNGHIVPALLAGNAVVYKGSELTPRSTAVMIECWQDLPPHVLQSISSDPLAGNYLAKHKGIDGLFFTGSYKTGALLMEAFRTHPEKILALEMSGNNPLVVTQVNDLQAAAYQTILSAYLTAGQRCSCARRLIVPEGRAGDAFIDTLVPLIESIVVGHYTDRPEPFMGPVIHPEAAEQLLTRQATYGSEGGHSLVEMRALESHLLTPGLMDVTDVKGIPDEELFGPFLKLIRVPTFEMALVEANNTAYGLSAALLSSDQSEYEAFYHEVRAGVINWNHPTTGASGRAPFGGLGKSGNHRPSGYYAADYCSYPVASFENKSSELPKKLTPGVRL